MVLAQGTVSVIDREGVLFGRVWCAYEASETIKLGKLYDVYTAGCARKESKPDELVVAGFTDGLSQADCERRGPTDDAGDLRRKTRREAAFPLKLARASVGIAVESTASTDEPDRLHILNSMIESDDLAAPPQPSDPLLYVANSRLRGKLAAAGLRKAFAEGDLRVQQEFLDALAADDSSRTLCFDLEGCRRLTAEGASQLAATIPVHIERLELHIRPHGTTFAKAWGNAQHFKDARPNGVMTSVGEGGLNLKDNELGDEGWAAIIEGVTQSKVSKVTAIDCSSESIGPVGARAIGEALRRMSAEVPLTALNVRGNALDADSARFLSKIASERRVTLFGTKRDQVAIEMSESSLNLVDAILLASDLRIVEALTKVELRRNEFGDEGWGALIAGVCANRISQITSINALGEGVGPACARAIREALVARAPGNSLTEINIRGHKLDRDSALALAKVATEKRVVLFGLSTSQGSAISLSGKKLQPVDTILIASDVAVIGATRVDLSHNNIGVEGAEAMTKVSNEALTDLNISHNGLDGVEGAAAIAESLKLNRSLTKLDATGNEFGDEGMEMIGVALLQSACAGALSFLLCDAFELGEWVQSLDYSGKSLDPATATLLAGVLKANTVLTELNLDSGGGPNFAGIGPQGATAFAEGLKGNSGLTKVRPSL